MDPAFSRLEVKKMVKLYRYDAQKEQWIFADYGVKSKENEYALQGYIVIYSKGGGKLCGTNQAKKG